MDKVLIVANSRYPQGTANSINVFRMACAFVSSGSDVKLVALRSSFMPKRQLWEETCRRYGDRQDIRGTFLCWPVVRAAEPVLALFSFFILLFLGRDTLVYTRISYVAILAAFMGFRTVFESHAPPKNYVLRRVESRLLGSDKTLVVFISDGLRRIYKAKGFDTSRTLIAPDAGRLLRTSVPQQEEFQGACRNIGYIGSLYRGRGFEIIVSIAKQMPERRFHIVGDIRQLSSYAHHLPDNITLYGAVSPDEAERMTGQFDAFLMPYQNEVKIGNNVDTSLWMSPMKMFEYMLSGRPIISSDLPVLKEILTDSENALLVDPADTGAWVDALHRLDSPQLRCRLAKKAFVEASANYTWDKRVQHILNHIDTARDSHGT